MKYPNGIKPIIKHNISYNNRGMNLENDINLSNEYYATNDIAYIYKKPTPIQITKVDYPSRKKAVIKEALFKEPSTTDYNGLYKGMYIDFEAKETNNKTSFSLNNIHAHQIKHIRNILNHNGIAFIIVRFNKLDTTYLLKGEDLINFIDTNSRKSIPIEYFKSLGIEIPLGYIPRLNYLPIIDQIYLEVAHGKYQ